MYNCPTYTLYFGILLPIKVDLQFQISPMLRAWADYVVAQEYLKTTTCSFYFSVSMIPLHRIYAYRRHTYSKLSIFFKWNISEFILCFLFHVFISDYPTANHLSADWTIPSSTATSFHWSCSTTASNTTSTSNAYASGTCWDTGIVHLDISKPPSRLSKV